MCEADNENIIIEKIRSAIDFEIKERERLLIEWLMQRQPDMYDKLINEMDDDLVNWKDKGSDISKKEFLQNEMQILREQ